MPTRGTSHWGRPLRVERFTVLLALASLVKSAVLVNNLTAFILVQFALGFSGRFLIRPCDLVGGPWGGVPVLAPQKLRRVPL